MIIAAMGCLMAWAGEDNYTQWVNPRIGTGGHGHVFLGANVPFGYVQLGPTEHTRGWDWCSGYHDSDSVLIGFGHQHLSGTGIGDLGDIALLPVTNRGQREVIFGHNDETISPGYYGITLRYGDKPYVTVELTATQRTGMHRYTFSPSQDNCLLLLDLGQGIGWDSPKQVKMKQLSPRMIAGYRHSSGWARNQKDFFAMEFSQEVTLEKLCGDTLGLISTPNNGEPLLIKTGLSAVSIENAIGNLMTENPGWDFYDIVRNAYKAWDAELSKVSIKTDNEDERAVFYTALYHTMVAPSVFCDVNGEYRGADGEVHEGDFTNYTTLSLWDTYRSAHPLQTLIHREKQADIAQTFLHIFEQQGKLPVWHLMGNETDCMVGNPGAIVLADLVLKGFVADRERAYQALKQTQLHDGRLLGTLREYGYIPYDKAGENETVAKALEYCIADDAVARVAKLLGHQDDYRYFHDRSRSYKKYFDTQTGFMRAVDADGKFREPFDPIKSRHRDDDYTEGNAWQYTWLVPHDVAGLVKLFGGKQKFLQKFDEFFRTEGDMGEFASPDISGFIGQYAHGNEPSHHILYMYGYVGESAKAAPLLRKVMDEMYHTGRDGLIGNEDVGQMSAWYILSAMGIYQVEPAGGDFIIGSPVLDRAEMNVGNGKTFTIVAEQNSRENIYVKAAYLNGKRLKHHRISFSDITRGGTLRLVMGNLK